MNKTGKISIPMMPNKTDMLTISEHKKLEKITTDRKSGNSG